MISTATPTHSSVCTVQGILIKINAALKSFEELTKNVKDLRGICVAQKVFHLDPGRNGH